MAVQVDESAHRLVAQQRHHQRAAHLAEVDERAAIGVANLVDFLGHQVGDMDDALSSEEPRRLCSRAVIRRIAAPIFDKWRGHTARRRSAEPPVLIDRELPERRFAEPHRLFEHRVEYRREVAGRRIDDLQHFGGRGLLLQCLARLGQEARILHCDDRLRREVLQ